MRNRTLLGAGAVVLALALAGCSSAPKVEDVETDGLIAACLDAAAPVAEGSGMTIDGTVSAVATRDSDEGTEVHVIFDARDENGTADPAACTFTVSGEEVVALKTGSPDSEPGTPVEGAADRWNEKHAEAWVDGKGPEAVPAPEPEGSSGASY